MSSKADRSEKRFTKAEKSWIMYDWANSIYATNIMAAIFPIYFAMRTKPATSFTASPSARRRSLWRCLRQYSAR